MPEAAEVHRLVVVENSNTQTSSGESELRECKCRKPKSPKALNANTSSSAKPLTSDDHEPGYRTHGLL